MRNLRDFPGVVITEMVEQGPPWMVTYLIDNVTVGSGLKSAAVIAMKAWCRDQFGPMGTKSETDTRWFLSEWDAFTMTNPIEATAFKVRWF